MMPTREEVYYGLAAWKRQDSALDPSSDAWRKGWYHAIQGPGISPTAGLEADEAWWDAVPWVETWPGAPKPVWVVVSRIDEWADLPMGDPLPTTSEALDAAIEEALVPREAGAIEPAGVKGRGVFAEEGIPAGSVFARTRAVVVLPDVHFPHRFLPWTFSWNRDSRAIVLSDITLTNHAAEPNAVTLRGVAPDGTPWVALRALVAIAEGDEITVNYRGSLVAADEE